MAYTHFTGPVYSTNGFESGTASSPIAITTAGNLNDSYGTTSAASGDTRLTYNKLTFTSTGSGETGRFFSVVTGAAAATAGTINGAHISLEVNGSGTISGAGNALRATLGGTSTNPGGTIAAIQADSNFASGGTWTNASFIRFTNSGTGTIGNLFNVPNGMLTTNTGAATKGLKVVTSTGVVYYIMLNTATS
jgi:hypothetical protein